jgi:MYXO-CTERM domain-containing protein
MKLKSAGLRNGLLVGALLVLSNLLSGAATVLYSGTFDATFSSDPQSGQNQGIDEFSGSWSFEFDTSLIDSESATQSFTLSLASFSANIDTLGASTLDATTVSAAVTFSYGQVVVVMVGMDGDGGGHDSAGTMYTNLDDFVLVYMGSDQFASQLIVSVADFPVSQHAVTPSNGNGTLSGSFSATAVPEPSSALLALAGVTTLAGVRRRR